MLRRMIVSAFLLVTVACNGSSDITPTAPTPTPAPSASLLDRTVTNGVRDDAQPSMATIATMAEGATTITHNDIFSVQFTVRNGCVPEDTVVTGTENSVSHITINPDGSFHTFARFNFQSVSAIGEITGNRYRGNGIYHWNLELTPGAAPQTQLINLRLMGLGAATDIILRMISHVTVNADGTVTASFTDETIECFAG